MYSTFEHGQTDCLIRRLKLLLHKYKVNAYMSGHDHSLQVSFIFLVLPFLLIGELNKLYENIK